MAVLLEGSIKRFIGLSTDPKPRPYTGRDADQVPGDMTSGETLPAGSTFLEADTGFIYRWDSESWQAAIPDDANGPLLAAILTEIRALREMVEMALNA